MIILSQAAHERWSIMRFSEYIRILRRMEGEFLGH